MCSMSKTGVVDWEFGGDHCSRLAGEFRQRPERLHQSCLSFSAVAVVVIEAVMLEERRCDQRENYNSK
jgi:hypothetical protein